MTENETDGLKSSVDEEFLFLQGFYEKGDDVQKLSVIQSLPQLILIDSNATLNKIIPKIVQELPKASCEFHIASSKVFKLLMEKQLPLNLLQSVIQGFESRDIIVANSWFETLLAAIPLLTEAQIKRDVIPLAQNKATMSKSAFYRVTASKLFGKIAAHPNADTFDVKKNILPLVQSLCQDCNNDVRAAMCSQLPYVAEAIGEAAVKQGLLSNIVELAADESMLVRSASVLTVVLLIPLLSSEVRTCTIIPLVKKLCTQSKNEGDITFITVSKEFGKILDVLQNNLTADDCAWFLNFYKTLSQKGFTGRMHAPDSIEPSQGVVCRQNCAFNLPAVTLFTVTHLNSQLQLWYSVFRDLAGDPCYLVRKTVAGCVHEVAKILGIQCKMIKQDIVRLLRDDAEEVIQMLVPNLGDTLELFACFGLLSRETPSQSTLEIGRAILKCQMELSSGYNWRMQSHFMYQLEHLPNCMPSDFIHQHFTPVILNIAVQGRARPVRSQATRTLLVFLRYNIKEIQRKWIRDTLIARLCYAPSCYTRHIYIKMCVHAMDLFSNKYFKEFFYVPLLGLSDDPVSNIRLCVVSLLPMMKHMVLSEDRKLQQCLDNVIARFEMAENNKDVMVIFKAKMKEYKAPADNSNERMNEERRKQEEEARILEGKSLGPIKRATPLLFEHLIGGDDNKVTALQRSISVPPQGIMQQKNVPRNISFLPQHFYADTGINIPMADSQNMEYTTMKSSKESEPDHEIWHRFDNDINFDEGLPQASKSDISSNEESNIEEVTLDTAATISKDETLNKNIETDNEFDLDESAKMPTVSEDSINLESLTEKDLQQLAHSTTNLTDDVKVNLRRIKTLNSPYKNQQNTKLNKRHSSVLSASCLENTFVNKSLNRRSLNMGKELSRIPVSFNTSRSKSSLNLKEGSNISNKFTSASLVSSQRNLGNEKLKNSSDKNGAKGGNERLSRGNTKEEFKVTKYVPKKTYCEDKALKRNDKENMRSSSSLPVLVKRTQSETKPKK